MINTLLLGIMGVVLVGALDFKTGYKVNFSSFYLAPIAYLTWKGSWRVGITIALASGLVAMFADDLLDKVTAHEIFSYWNALNRLSFFLLTVFMVDRIRSLYTRQTLLVAELNTALADVRRLSGLLPMCSWCKKIRSDKGFWHQVEEYLSEHSEAQFTHGICPQCDSQMRDMVVTNQPAS